MSKFLAPIFLLLLSATAVLILPFLLETPEAAVSLTLLQDLSSIRPGGGRLFDAPAEQPSAHTAAAALRGAEVAILSMKEARHIQGLVDIQSGNLNAAAEILLDASRAHPGDASVLNDLGVVYLAEGSENASLYLKAIQVFERARRSSPAALSPRYNLILAYRRTGLDTLARGAQLQYERLEQEPAWTRRLAEDEVPPDESGFAAELLQLLDSGSEPAATSLFAKHVEFYRRLATDEALNPSRGGYPSRILRFAARRLKLDHQDDTVASMLAPLDGPYRERVIQSRRHVHDGIALYLKTRYVDSLHQYDLAEHEIAGVPAGFDTLWIELNRANTELRVSIPANMKTPAGRLEHTLGMAEVHRLRWMKAQALTAKATPGIERDFGQMRQDQMASVRELSEIGARYDAVRALNYLANIYSSANDFETSFQYLQLARRLTQKDDHVRLTQLNALGGSVALRLGCARCGIAFAEQGVEEARKSMIDSGMTNAQAILATVLEANNERERARRYLVEIRSTADQLASYIDRQYTELAVNFLCSRIEIADGHFTRAERCLQDNAEIMKLLKLKSPDYSSEILLQLARVYQHTARIDQARHAFEKAADVIEADDRDLGAPGLRSSFENQRRNLYDTAITFEADHNGMDAAWTYLQRYRSKLFLEFLGQMNPKVNVIHDEAVQRNQVQKLIPNEVQVVEYVMLPDRLLIWLVSGDRFVSQSVAVSRAELQSTVASFLEGMQKQQDVALQSEKLYRLLIAPIEDKLDPHRAIAIIPDQDLHRLPFPALWNASKRHFLIEDFTLLESPNLTQLLATSGVPLRTSAVAFGPISGELSDAAELLALKTIYPGEKTLTGSSTNKQEFLRAMTDANIFHYSGHSVDASDPLRSSLLLDGDREGPNSITALDVSQQHMRANSLVVLASCDSSVGNSRDGIGMRGLTSAFLISGAGSVVGSLWLVETFSTSRLVSNFHQRYAAGTSAAEALRQAQIAFIRSGVRNAHPYYWSGFVVTGNLSALR